MLHKLLMISLISSTLLTVSCQQPAKSQSSTTSQIQGNASGKTQEDAYSRSLTETARPNNRAITPTSTINITVSPKISPTTATSPLTSTTPFSIKNTPLPTNASLSTNSPLPTNSASIQVKSTAATPNPQMVNILSIDPTILIDLKYATKDNFTRTQVYSFKACLLRSKTAVKLKKANDIVKKENYRIKVYDGYRPIFAQELFWKLVPDTRYVANPNTGGSIHNRGCAVDLTLVDASGKELEMPSKFDDFSEKASRTNLTMSPLAKSHLKTLTDAMVTSGFNPLNTEWWHYSDSESSDIKIIDVNPEDY